MGLAVLSSSAMANAGYTLLPVPPPENATRIGSLLELEGDEWHEIDTLLGCLVIVDGGVLWKLGKEKERLVAINALRMRLVCVS